MLVGTKVLPTWWEEFKCEISKEDLCFNCEIKQNEIKPSGLFKTNFNHKTKKSELIFIALFVGEGNGTPLQHSCLENPMDGTAWWAAVHGVAKSQTRLHFHFSLSCIGEGNGNPLQCSCLENPRDRGASWAAIYGVTQSRTRLKQLSSSSSMRTL